MTKSFEHQQSDAEHIWHVWINKRQQSEREHNAEHKQEHSLYEFKSLLQFLAYGHLRIKEAFEGNLPQSHRQCSRTVPVPILNNKLNCCLGQEVTGCTILQSLRSVFIEHTNRTMPPDGHKAYELADEWLYRLMANTCAWHIYKEAMGIKEDFRGVDTTEGHLLDVSDRMFWDRVYESMSYDPNEDDEVKP